MEANSKQPFWFFLCIVNGGVANAILDSIYDRMMMESNFGGRRRGVIGGETRYSCEVEKLFRLE